jgi:hypothetical protein
VVEILDVTVVKIQWLVALTVIAPRKVLLPSEGHVSIVFVSLAMMV